MSKKIIDSIFNLITIIFFVNPFLLILYTQFLGIDIRELIAINPYMNITFITSFITPFFGFYIMQLKQKLVNDGKIETVLVHLFVIAISLLIIDNITFSILIFILIFYIFHYWKIRVKDAYYYFKKTRYTFKDWLAPIVVTVVSVVIRLMLILVSNS